MAHTEAELHRGLLNNLGEFLIEMARDFCFVRSEVPLQVGNQDFALDLLFFHRFSCMKLPDVSGVYDHAGNRDIVGARFAFR